MFLFWLQMLRISYLLHLLAAQEILENERNKNNSIKKMEFNPISIALKVNILLEKEIPLSLLQIYKIGIQYVLTHYNEIIQINKKKIDLNNNKSIRFELNNLLSYSQYKLIKKYKELVELVATDKFTERKNILEKIQPGEITIICHYSGNTDSNDNNELEDEIKIDGPCDAVVLISLNDDPLISIFKGLEKLMVENFLLPNIFYESFYQSERELLNFSKEINHSEFDEISLINSVMNCLCRYNDCNNMNVQNVVDLNKVDKNKELTQIQTQRFELPEKKKKIPPNTLQTQGLSIFPNLGKNEMKKVPVNIRKRNQIPLKQKKKLSSFTGPIRLRSFDDVINRRGT